MNIYWEENERSGDKPEKKIEGSVDLSNAIMNDTETSYVIHEIEVPPQPVGGYDITGNVGGPGSYMFMFLKKPNWFHRACSRFFLGWKWFDGDGLNRKVKK
jgi:hypothetical protein